METNKNILLAENSCAPTFEGMLQVLQHAGYTLETSGLEESDNPLDYGVSEHLVHIHSDDKLMSRRVNIDNAEGMDALGLKQAWQTAGNPKKRANGSIGKFGIGLNGATLSMCNDITIASRQVNGTVSCLHASVRAMKATNRFEPTEFGENVDEVYLRKFFHPSDIKTFLALPSGTMIQEMDFLPEMIVTADQAVERIKLAIGSAYSQLGETVKFFIQLDDKDREAIPLNDIFYHNNPDAIRFKHITELVVYDSDRVGGPCRVIEHLTSDRSFHGGKLVKGSFYEHSERKKGEKYSQGMKPMPAKDVQKLQEKRRGVLQLEMIQVNEDTFALEPEGQDNKGFHLIRDKRTIGSGLRLGHKIHDRTDEFSERQRMQVRFDTDLDKFMGSTWNKTIRDASLPQAVIGDALMRVYNQCKTKWSKQCEQAYQTNVSCDEYDSEESQTVDVPTAVEQVVATPTQVETNTDSDNESSDNECVASADVPQPDIVSENVIVETPEPETQPAPDAQADVEAFDPWVNNNMEMLLDPKIKASILRLYGL
jgi:hypothetical protein